MLLCSDFDPIDGGWNSSLLPSCVENGWIYLRQDLFFSTVICCDCELVRELGKKNMGFSESIEPTNQWSSSICQGKCILEEYISNIDVWSATELGRNHPGVVVSFPKTTGDFLGHGQSTGCWRGDPNISETFRWGHFSHIQLGKSNGRMFLIPIGPVGSRWEFLAIFPYKLPEVWNLTITTTLGLVPR